MLPPGELCRKHLLGEHVESHMLAGTLEKGRSIGGFIEKGLLEPSSLIKRHEALAAEMSRRGYSHKSPLDNSKVSEMVSKLNERERLCIVDRDLSRSDLWERCEQCRELMKAGQSRG